MDLRKPGIFSEVVKNVLCVGLAVTVLAFKLLRLIFGAFQAVYWELNGTAKQVREADRPENYERSAQVLNRHMMFKFSQGQLYAMDNFICTHNRFESPQYVFDNDNINLMFVTDTHAVFCEPKRKDMQLWRSEFGPMIRQAQKNYCSKLIVVPLSVFHRMAESIGDPKGEIIFLLNMGRCGSTLLQKLLEETGRCVTIGEPDSISRIVGKYRRFGATPEIRQLAYDIVRMECRPYRSFQPAAYVIKVIGSCSSAMPFFGELYPKARYLYIYRNVINVAKSSARMSNVGPSMLRYMQLMYPKLMNDWMGYGGTDYTDAHFDNFLTWAAARALATMKAYVDFRRQGFDIKGVRYEDLVTHPLETCQRIMEACGFPESLAEKAVRGMQDDSQKKTKISRERMKKFRDAEVTTDIIESMNMYAAKYDLPPVNEECILEGTMA